MQAVLERKVFTLQWTCGFKQVRRLLHLRIGATCRCLFDCFGSVQPVAVYGIACVDLGAVAVCSTGHGMEKVRVRITVER